MTECFAAIAHKMLGIAVEGDVCASIHRATGGNPFYVLELVRGLKRADHPMGERVIDESVLRYQVCACKLRARLMRSDLAPGVQAKRGSSPSNLTNCR
jgi:hypothetical protein